MPQHGCGARSTTGWCPLPRLLEPGDQIRFRNSRKGEEEILTLYVEKQYDDAPYVVGWCPELKNTMSVHLTNVVDDK